MQSLIVDFHVGCIQSLQSTLERQGHETHVISYSQHNFVIEHLIQDSKNQPSRLSRFRTTVSLFGFLGLLKKYQKTKRAIRNRRPIGSKSIYDIVWCCFPPGIYTNLANSKLARRTIVVISHRMDMGFEKTEHRDKFWKKVIRDSSNPDLTFVASNEYDAKYFEYYSNTPIPVIEIETPYIQIPALSPDLPVLIGPSHVNAESQLVKKIRQNFPEIKTIKENYSSYSFDQLSRHKAFILLPYSIYSISLLELSSLGVPILVPSDEFLISSGILNDVSLFPLYGSQEKISKFEKSCSVESPGPNCDCTRCRKYWLQFAFWKSLPNVLYWESIADLGMFVNDIENNIEVSTPPVSVLTRTKLKDIY